MLPRGISLSREERAGNQKKRNQLLSGMGQVENVIKNEKQESTLEMTKYSQNCKRGQEKMLEIFNSFWKEYRNIKEI